MIRGGQGGVRMPAEWEPHEATWLAWPHLASDWPGKLDAARRAFVEFAQALQEHERVCILARDTAEQLRIQSKIRRAGGTSGRVEFFICPTDRSWLRDSGPTFTVRGNELRAVCWHFDAWGQYPNWKQDARIGRFIAEAAGAAVAEPMSAGTVVAMEGGAVESNGNGTIMTTEQCLLGEVRLFRDRVLSRDEAEDVLRSALGAANVVWLDRGIAGDDTSGHIDQLARFVGPRTVAAIVETNPRDENFEPLRENLRRLRRSLDEQGRQFEIVELPMPRPVVFDGERVPASYANFYVANGCVLVPTFNDPSDPVAMRILGECFPGREVRGIHCVEMALGLGTLHCLAQQQPKLREPDCATEFDRRIMGAEGMTTIRALGASKRV